MDNFLAKLVRLYRTGKITLREFLRKGGLVIIISEWDFQKVILIIDLIDGTQIEVELKKEDLLCTPEEIAEKYKSRLVPVTEEDQGEQEPFVITSNTVWEAEPSADPNPHPEIDPCQDDDVFLTEFYWAQRAA